MDPTRIGRVNPLTQESSTKPVRVTYWISFTCDPSLQIHFKNILSSQICGNFEIKLANHKLKVKLLAHSKNCHYKQILRGMKRKKNVLLPKFKNQPFSLKNLIPCTSQSVNNIYLASWQQYLIERTQRWNANGL